jgi:hypothetical protein
MKILIGVHPDEGYAWLESLTFDIGGIAWPAGIFPLWGMG